MSTFTYKFMAFRWLEGGVVRGGYVKVVCFRKCAWVVEFIFRSSVVLTVSSSSRGVITFLDLFHCFL